MHDFIGFEYTPFSLIIFIITLAVSLYAFYGKKEIFPKLVLHPFSMVRKKRWFTIITSGFIHANWMHLLFNMMAFYFFAFYLEAMFRQVTSTPLTGSLFFLVIYFGSMVLGDLTSVIKNKDNPQYSSLGASGAISGVVFSFILFNPTAPMGIFPLPPIIPAWIFGILFIAYSYYSAKRMGGGINHEAHLWGAVAGLVLTIILIPDVVEVFIHQLTG